MHSFIYPFLKKSVVVFYTDKGVVEISFSNKKAKEFKPKNTIEKRLSASLKKYLSGQSSKLDVQIDWKNLKGTDFQKKVWRKMHKIPFGKVKTYGEIAESIQSPKAFRAVGTACGKNPVMLAIPCHRVVGSNGIGGFSSGGLSVKRELHRLEGIELFK